ncbi:TlpA family protein disulfide reductase [Candidatus Palauibacter sp.]|uniref:TlpA family protein disulfide reductase n=1 Tax=Candidatus Palauibacter sp. TaxID=3101350 RepID=UPI003CC6B63D
MSAKNLKHPNMTRRTRHTVVALAGLAWLAGSGPLSAQAGEGQVSLPMGTEAPDAALQDLDGNDVQLLDYADGKPTLIEFWASWCEQCEALQPEIDQVQADFGEQVNVVAVVVAVAQSLRRVRRYAETHGAEYPYLWDASGDAVRAYSATTTSIVVILDAEGKVAYTGVGPDQDLVGAVRGLLSGE